jgi:hypothetical protein
MFTFINSKFPTIFLYLLCSTEEKEIIHNTEVDIFDGKSRYKEIIVMIGSDKY